MVNKTTDFGSSISLLLHASKATTIPFLFTQEKLDQLVIVEASGTEGNGGAHQFPGSSRQQPKCLKDTHATPNNNPDVSSCLFMRNNKQK